MKLSTLFFNLNNTSYIHTKSGLDYAVRGSGTTLYIYFQHSNGELDWKNNLDFPAKPYKEMKCKEGKFSHTWYAHRGFLRMWKEAETYLSKYILDTRYQKIIVSGYSHGAALALLCHEYIWYNRPDLRHSLEGYGFGCPRVIWGIKSKCHKERWARFYVVKNIDDLITHLPPFIFGYFHVGNMLKIGARGRYSMIRAHFPDSYMTELLNKDL